MSQIFLCQLRRTTDYLKSAQKNSRDTDKLAGVGTWGKGIPALLLCVLVQGSGMGITKLALVG